MRCDTKRSMILSAMFTSAVVAANTARADFTYAFVFGLPSEVQLNGNAVYQDNQLRITTDADQVGSFWHNTPQRVDTGFTTTFNFEIRGGPSNQIVGDGFAFVLQTSPDGPAALGGGGSSVGYGAGFGAGQSREVTRSIAIEFDTFSFGPPGELEAAHVAIHTQGVGANDAGDFAAIAAADLLSQGIDLYDGMPHSATIQYIPADGTTASRMEVYIDSILVLAADVDLTNINGDDITNSGEMYVGFTAATGLADSVHIIDSWGFNDDSGQCASPYWYLMGWGSAGVGGPSSISWQVLGSRPLNFRWFRYGQELLDDDGGRIVGLGTDFLRFTTTTYADLGHYTSVAENACGSATSIGVYIGACIADTDDGSGTGVADGGVGVEDLLYYLSEYDIGSIRADIDDGQNFGIADGGVGIEDLLFFLSRYDAGC